MTYVVSLSLSIVQIIFVNVHFKEVILIDILYIATLTSIYVSLGLTTYTDPGIIPRKENRTYKPEDRGITKPKE